MKIFTATDESNVEIIIVSSWTVLFTSRHWRFEQLYRLSLKPQNMLLRDTLDAAERWCSEYEKNHPNVLYPKLYFVAPFSYMLNSDKRSGVIYTEVCTGADSKVNFTELLRIY